MLNFACMPEVGSRRIQRLFENERLARIKLKRINSNAVYFFIGMRATLQTALTTIIIITKVINWDLYPIIFYYFITVSIRNSLFLVVVVAAVVVYHIFPLFRLHADWLQRSRLLLHIFLFIIWIFFLFYLFCVCGYWLHLKFMLIYFLEKQACIRSF